MNILMLQSAGLNKENKEYKKLCFKAFNDMDGVEAVLFGPGNQMYGWEDLIKWCDVILHMEDYRSHWVPELKNINKKKVFWSMDTHITGKNHLNYARGHKFHIFLTAVKTCAQQFKGAVNKVEWFPNCYPEHLFEPILEEKCMKECDLRFVGNVANRGNYIDKLKEQNGMEHVIEIGDEMVRHIRDTRIHWNKNISHDLNCRVFETMGCKTFLLTDYAPGMNDLFVEGTHYEGYFGYKECQKKIEYYLRNDREREEIALNGYMEAKAKHTDTIRAKQIVEMCK